MGIEGARSLRLARMAVGISVAVGVAMAVGIGIVKAAGAHVGGGKGKRPPIA